MISSKPDEIILIAGKGHEETQIYGKKIFKVSDQKIINEVNLKNQKKISDINKNILKNKIILNEILRKNIKRDF